MACHLLRLSDAVLGEIMAACSREGTSLHSLASTCTRLQKVATRLCATRLHLRGSYAADQYKQGINHAVQGMPCLETVSLEYNRTSPADEAVAGLALYLKALRSLRKLSIATSITFTALDMVALGELQALTALHLAVQPPQPPTQQPSSSCSSAVGASTVAELQPLTRLTALQQLVIEGWHPLGLYPQQQQGEPGPAPAPAAVCCLPAGSLTSLQFKHTAARGMWKWLPHILCCTSLQQLELLHIEGPYMGIGGSSSQISVQHVMDGIVEHLAALTVLRMLVADEGKASCDWTPKHHLSNLQHLQQLQFQSDCRFATYGACMVSGSSSPVFQCTALQELGECVMEGDEQPSFPAGGMLLPQLKRLRLMTSCDIEWPSSSFANLESLQVLSFQHEIPCSPAQIPGSQHLTELCLEMCAADGVLRRPELADMQAMARCLPRLRSLHLVLPAALEESEDARDVATGWLEALASFTQIHQLSVIVALNPTSIPDLALLVRPADTLRVLGKLQQLQRVALSGWMFQITPCFVVGLEMGLQQLQVLQLEGCCGLDDGELQLVKSGLRQGLSLEWKDGRL